jgi:hypothetical protein
MGAGLIYHQGEMATHAQFSAAAIIIYHVATLLPSLRIAD